MSEYQIENENENMENVIDATESLDINGEVPVSATTSTNIAFDEYDVANMQGAPRIVVPKQVAYGQSYANAHQSHKESARTQQQQQFSRAPQELRKKPTAEELKAVEASKLHQQQQANKKQKQIGQAVVKAVLSGDALLLRLPAPAGTIPPEKIMGLSGITAPRCARGKKMKDEPFGWESREFLRKKAVGQIVNYTVTFSLPNGKDVGIVKLGNANGENLAASMVAAGFADVTATAPRKDGSLHPDRQALVELKEKAQTEAVGMWTKDANRDKHVRIINWNVESEARSLLEKHKTTPLQGIVDQVRDGSTLRIEIPSTESRFPLQHKIITLYLAGIQAPRIPLVHQEASAVTEETQSSQNADEEAGQEDDDEQEEKKTKKPKQRQQPVMVEAPEPYSLAAREFVEQRLLGREVGVLIQGIDKMNNLFGSVIFAKGDISTELLRNGLARVVSWSAALTPHANQLREAEKSAQSTQLNMWSVNAPPSSSLTTAAVGDSDEKMAGTVNNQSFEAKVVQIVSGDTVVLLDRLNNSRRFYLASVLAPRVANPRANQNAQPWSSEAKEYLRKKLIGKKVRVAVEYTRTPPAATNEKTPRAFVSLYFNKVNVTEQLVLAGLAQVIQHRVDEERSSNYDLLLAAEAKAAAAKAGIHGGNPPKVVPPVDLTHAPRTDASSSEDKTKAENATRLLSAKVKQYLPFLQKEKALRGVVEFVLSSTRIKVFIPTQNCLISFVLGGVRGPISTKDKPDPYAEEALKYARNTLSQQDVRLEVESLDKGDNFIGTMYFGQKNFAITLLEEGYVSVFAASASRMKNKDELFGAEEKAKTAKLNIWKNWTPPKETPVETKEEKSEETEFSKNEQLINVQVTEVIDPSKFYATIVGDEANSFVEEEMKKFAETVGSVPAPTDFAPKKGNICAGMFEEGEWHRVKIEKRISDDEFECLFIDYGNTEFLAPSQLRPIANANIRSVAPLARLCTLAGLKGPHSSSEQYDFACHEFSTMVYDKQLLGKVLLRDASGVLHITLYDGSSPQSINQQLLRDGLVRIRSRPDRRLRELCNSMVSDQEAAQTQRLGIWEFGNVSDPEEEDGDFGSRKH